jgi:hypothetical protein
MFGFRIGDLIFVEAARNSIDGVWFLIFTGLFALFCIKDKYGKYPLSAFVLIWFVVQLTSHWYYTVFGASEEKIVGYNEFFANTFRLLPVSGNRVVPDFYHIVLHILILFALLCLILYCIRSRKKR